MAVFNTITYASLQGAKRIEAEYYHPSYMSLMSKLCNKHVIRLGRLAFVTDGIHASIDYDENSNIYCLSAQSVRDGFFDLSAQTMISSGQHQLNLRTSIREGDVIISSMGTIGLAAVAYSEMLPANAVRQVLIVRPKENRSLFSYYLAAFLNSKYGLFQSLREATGNVQQHLFIDKVVRFLIPHLSIQQKVGELYKLAEQKLVFSLEVINIAEQLLLAELGLQDWKPARVLTYVRNYSQAAKARRIDAEYFHPKLQEMFSRIPAQIRFDRLGRLTNYTKGVEVGSESYTNSGIPFWRVSNLSKHGLDDSNANFISQDLYESLRQNYEPQQFEILLSKDATPGLAYYLEHPIQGIVSSGILRLAIIDAIPPHYLELVLNSLLVQMQIEQDAGGSIIKHWKPSEVRKTLVPRLPDDKEKEISDLVQKSHAARREAKALLEKAKRAVEIAIEENEERAMESIEK